MLQWAAIQTKSIQIWVKMTLPIRMKTKKKTKRKKKRKKDQTLVSQDLRTLTDILINQQIFQIRPAG
ncbi:hypothetical protein ABID82_005062 [Methylobacterium sp. PvP062]